ncbi:MAG: MFS transporter [Alphaproteobacteria bacterium]|nr:MFS transporter [Alphaproteobacteria bacterium]MCW5739135.1 MFS transporter [Alphaproteobacteria bacterium]
MTASALDNSPRRDFQVMGLIGMAHGISHFYQQALPPLFVPMKDAFQVSFTELGALLTVLSVTSCIGQMLAGIAVDRYGARRLLIAGLALIGAALALAGFAQSYWHLVVLAVVAGIGNCVFHPCDFAILNASVSQPRLGRAYGTHGLFGTLGWPAAIALMWFLSETVGWRYAAMIAGTIGIAMAMIVAASAHLFLDHRVPSPAASASGGARHGARGAGSVSLAVLFSAPILMCLVYFIFTAMTGPSINAFGSQALASLYSVTPKTAANAVIAYYVGSACGVIAGGWLADRTQRHDRVAAGGLLSAALLMGFAATLALPFIGTAIVMALAGFCAGCTGPSRDMIVRGATPPGAAGKVFGFVYSGLDIGSAIGPLIFGYMMDHGMPQGILIMTAVLFAMAMISVLQVRRVSQAHKLAAA